MKKETRYIVALSGGKDSVAMALRLKELYPHRKFTYIITPTGDELPEMKAHWKKLEKLLGTITRLKGKTLFDLIEQKNMIPNFQRRWCTIDLKIEPMIDYLEDLPDNSIMYVGLRADEGGRFGLSALDKKFVGKISDAGLGVGHKRRYGLLAIKKYFDPCPDRLRMLFFSTAGRMEKFVGKISGKI